VDVGPIVLIVLGVFLIVAAVMDAAEMSVGIISLKAAGKARGILQPVLILVGLGLLGLGIFLLLSKSTPAKSTPDGEQKSGTLLLRS